MIPAQLLRAARFLCNRNASHFDQHGQSACLYLIENPRDCADENDNFATREAFAEFEIWCAGLSDKELQTVSTGFEKEPEPGRIIYTDGDSIEVEIPDNCNIVLDSLFRSLEMFYRR